MINAEYTDNGKRVIIPVELWENFRELFEYIQIYELVQERKRQPAVHSLDNILAEEGLTRDELESRTD
ncbi:MAG TPA: hypothetical protein ENK58_10105 [Desulfobacterales bacterium]|nr:hypothetical protein [Desulfobacterales bacterium]